MKTVKSIKSKTTTLAAKAVAVITPAREKAVKVTAAKAPAAPTTRAVAPRREIATDLIAARAYTLWEQQGRPQGKDLQNWLQAESQLKQEVQSFTA